MQQINERVSSERRASRVYSEIVWSPRLRFHPAMTSVRYGMELINLLMPHHSHSGGDSRFSGDEARNRM
jgi:hypothetical protein